MEKRAKKLVTLVRLALKSGNDLFLSAASFQSDKTSSRDIVAEEAHKVVLFCSVPLSFETKSAKTGDSSSVRAHVRE